MIIQLTGTVLNICYDYQHASKDQTVMTNWLKSLCEIIEWLLELAMSKVEKGTSCSSVLEWLIKLDGELIKYNNELTTLWMKLQ
jgi:hypothetical protein